MYPTFNRSPRKTFGVVVAATAALAVSASSAGAATIDSGNVDWGVKQSFRDYVTGPFAQGTITVQPPATRNSDGTFDFPGGTGTYDPANGDLSIDTNGGVDFKAHAGALDTKFSDVRVQISGNEGVLIVDTVSKGFSDPTPVTYDDVELASLDLTGIPTYGEDDGSLELTGIPATLTEEGAPAFGGFYEPGTELDPVSVTITYAQSVSPVITPQAGSQEVRKSGKAKVATIDCGTAACVVDTPGKVTAERNGKTLKLKLDAPSDIASGEIGKVKGALNSKSVGLLRKQPTRFEVPISVTAEGETVDETVKVKLTRK